MLNSKTIIFSFLIILIISITALFIVIGWLLWVNLNNPISLDNYQHYQLPKTIEEQLAAQDNINKFKNYEEYKNFLEENAGSGGVRSFSFDDNSLSGKGSNEMAVSEEAVAPKITSNEATGFGAGSGNIDYSETNIQVEGVDEADIIKTDGKYIYALARNILFIIDAYPATSSQVISKIEFNSTPQGIFINDDRLAVYGYDNHIFENENFSSFRRSNYAFFKIFDLTDRRNPKQVRDLKFEGTLSNSRMIGDYVYFITSYYGYQFIQEEPIVPRILENGEVISNTCASSNCVMPDIYYFDIPYYSRNLTSISVINLKDENADINSEYYILSGNQNVYVSQNNIYIVYTKYISEYQLEQEVLKELVYPMLSPEEQKKIVKIESVENFILNKEEKISKVTMIINNYLQSLSPEEQDSISEKFKNAMREKYEDISQELEKTIIHKIAIKGGNVEYNTKGEVEGQVLNQFSMDEKDGYFRIATTKNQIWSKYLNEEDKKSYNNLYVLDGDLNIVGSIEKLAKDERIYSVRFIRDRAYMITFEQVDPLFVIDLSEPTNPKVLGELKIPGYSNYLHPYDNNFLIGLGKATKVDENDRVHTLGIKLSLFDVSDVTNPKEIDNYILGDAGSQSIALYDHKAFLFSKDKNLLAIPVILRSSSDDVSYGKLDFSGAVIFNIDENGFTLKGKIDHSDGGESSEQYWQKGYLYYDNNVKRILYIGDTLYTFSNKYLKMNDLDQLKEIKSLNLITQEDIKIITPEPIPLINKDIR